MLARNDNAVSLPTLTAKIGTSQTSPAYTNASAQHPLCQVINDCLTHLTQVMRGHCGREPTFAIITYAFGDHSSAPPPSADHR